MEVTALTWIVAVTGLVLIGLLSALQLVAVVNPRGEWTVKNVYGGSPIFLDCHSGNRVHRRSNGPASTRIGDPSTTQLSG